MPGQFVLILQDYKHLREGEEGIVSGVGESGWIVVFRSVSLTFPFADANKFYRIL